jgi:hypothetical protein
LRLNIIKPLPSPTATAKNNQATVKMDNGQVKTYVGLAKKFKKDMENTRKP